MKFSLLTLVLLFSQNTFSTPITTLKVADGGVGTCVSNYDIDRSKNGAYVLEAKSAEVIGEKLRTRMVLNFHTCKKTRVGFQFVAVGPYTAQKQIIVNTQNELEELEVVTKSVSLSIINDDYELLYKLAIAKESGTSQELYVDLNISDILVGYNKVRFDLFLQKEMTFTSINQNFSYANTLSFGAFRVNAEISIDGTTAQIIK